MSSKIKVEHVDDLVNDVWEVLMANENYYSLERKTKYSAATLKKYMKIMLTAGKAGIKKSIAAQDKRANASRAEKNRERNAEEQARIDKHERAQELWNTVLCK